MTRFRIAAAGWVDPARQDCTGVEIREAVVEDGWEIAGHRATVRELGTPTECTASPSNRRRKMAGQP